MESNSIVLTREELYEEVWQHPITTLAKKYGLSDVGLAKLCKRHHLPTPERGYWAKKQHNRILPKRPKLPVLSTKNRYLEQIVITPHIDFVSSGSEIDEISAYEQLYENKVTIEYSDELKHPLVIKTTKSLNGAKPAENGALKPKAKNCLDIKVTRGCIDRASHILDALTTALEARGAKLISKFYNFYDKELLGFELNGIHIKISLVETIQRSRHLKSAEELARIKRDPYYRYKLPHYDYIPTGKLTLKMEDLWGYKGRKSWSDAKYQRLENCLNDFIISFRKATLVLQEKEEQDRLDEIAQQQERQRREQLEKEKIEERKRIDQLNADCDNWHKSQRIRKYIEAVKLNKANGAGRSSEWLHWAVNQANRLDPLVISPESILDQE